MNKRIKNKDISETIFSVTDYLNNLKKNEEFKDDVNLNKAIEKLKEFNIFLKGLKNLLFILFVGFVIALGLYIYSTSKIYDLYNINNELTNEVNLSNQKIDSTLSKLMGIKVEKNNDSTITSYSYLIKGNELVTYEKLINENDSLSNKISQLKNTIDNLELKISMAKEVYGLNFSEFKENSKSYIKLESKKLDSAYILYEHYKKNLFFDEKSKEWYIKENSSKK